MGSIDVGGMTSRDHRELDLVRALRERSTSSETIAWSLLRDRRCCGAKFRRQHPLHGRVADFWCHRLRLVIEIDGPSHIGRETQDRQRDAELARHGIATYRVAADAVNEGILREAVRARARELGMVLDGD